MLARMEKSPLPFVTCGMYAFTDAQRSAWSQLFEHFFAIAGKTVELRFEHAPDVLLDDGLWFGHTCGYPLMTRLQPGLQPFCVPVFDVPGCTGGLYSSRIIVPADSAVERVEDARGRIVAMNNADSNSGMNVLRFAVAGLQDNGRFFDRVLTTGGHLDSLRTVAEGRADIAAIDCISFQLIADWLPELASRIRVIAESVQSCGLPFVMPRQDASPDAGRSLIAQLVAALDACAPAVTDCLHLRGFDSVTIDDYRSIVEIEQQAIDRGYPRLG